MSRQILLARFLFAGLFLFALGAVAGPSLFSTGEAIAQKEGKPGSFAEIARELTPAVVNISTKQRIKLTAEERRMMEFYERLFPGFRNKKRELRNGLGSGFVVEKSGYILTNNHVIERAEEIVVTFGDGNGESKEYVAKVVGTDPKTDIALIKIKSQKPLPTLPLGDSDMVDIGEWVMAVGNPFGFSRSVTVGVVSAKGRVIGAGAYDDFIQTDAAINQGNSGGPLINTEGKAIGINTAIYTRGSQGSIGIGFAIPINAVKSIYDDLKKGKVRRGRMGVQIQSVTPEIKESLGLPTTKGALISEVVAGSAADKAGLKRSDLIIAFDGEKVVNSQSLPKIVAARKPGETVTILIIRDGKKKKVSITLDAMPGEEGPEEAPPSTDEPDTLGLTVDKVTEDTARHIDAEPGVGVVVTEVNPDSPAGEANFSRGDVILEVNKTNVNSPAAFRKAVGKVKPGKVILFVVKRQERTFYVTIKVPKE